MRSKELSWVVKQAVIRLENQIKPIGDRAKPLSVEKHLFGKFLKRKKGTSELSNAKRPRRLWKTTVATGWILSLVKKNPFTTVGQEPTVKNPHQFIKNLLQESGECVNRQRRLLQREYRGFTARWKPPDSLKNRKPRLVCQTTWLLTKAAGWNPTCFRQFYLLIFSQILQNSMEGASQCRWPEEHCKSSHRVF